MSAAPKDLAWPPRPRLAPLRAGGLVAHAPAKINLSLLVGPRRADGYHPIDSIVTKVTLYDRLELRPRSDGRVVFSCRGADCGPDEGNLALLAWRAVASACGDTRGVAIRLRKAIPPGAGLGGGSSDAAAVLAAANRLLGGPLGAGALFGLAAGLGSDVPLFLGGPASRITGRGERVAPVRLAPFLAVLFLPGFACSTAAVYRAYDEAPARAGRQIGPAALGRPPSAWRGRLRNDLSAAARKVSPPLAELWDALSAAIRLPVCLTGSGSGLFVLCDGPAEAWLLRSQIPPNLPCRCIVVRANPW